MVDAMVSKTIGHNARAGSTPALGTNLIQSRGSCARQFITSGASS